MNKKQNKNPEKHQTPQINQNNSQDDEKKQWHDKYLRALADYHNLEQRVQNQINQAVSKANQNLLIKIIEIVDDIEKAEVFIKDEGLKLIKNKINKILSDENVYEIDLKDKVYDPYLAECVEMVNSDNNNIIVSVEKKGYQLNGQLLRPAKVKVSKKINS